jgi:hypothetical protein
MRLVPRLPMRLRKLRTPTAQLLAAVLVALTGAWLIGLWMVGIVLMLVGGLWGADAVLRDTDTPARQPLHTHDDVLERYRRAR